LFIFFYKKSERGRERERGWERESVGEREKTRAPR
jgi:hypothetical protein